MQLIDRHPHDAENSEHVQRRRSRDASIQNEIRTIWYNICVCFLAHVLFFLHFSTCIFWFFFFFPSLSSPSSKLDHQNIVKAFGKYTHPDCSICLVMEYCNFSLSKVHREPSLNMARNPRVRVNIAKVSSFFLSYPWFYLLTDFLVWYRGNRTYWKDWHSCTTETSPVSIAISNLYVISPWHHKYFN